MCSDEPALKLNIVKRICRISQHSLCSWWRTKVITVMVRLCYNLQYLALSNYVFTNKYRGFAPSMSVWNPTEDIFFKGDPDPSRGRFHQQMYECNIFWARIICGKFQKNLPMPNKLGAHKHTLIKHVSKIEWRFLANTHELGTFLLALQSFVKLTLCSKISIKNN